MFGEDGFILDFKTSCTVDEAVAKMLGYMRACVRRKIIPIGEYGMNEEVFNTLPSFVGDIEEHFYSLYNDIGESLNAAQESNDIEQLNIYEEKLRHCDALCNNARLSGIARVARVPKLLTGRNPATAVAKMRCRETQWP